MDADRIERALREGPPDEPTYVPGAFRDQRTRGGLALAAASLGLALVAGIVIGTGLGILRSDPSDLVGGPAASPRPLAAEDLQGMWTSGELDRDTWTDALRERGFTQDDIDAFLLHDPFESTVRYFMVFRGAALTIGATYDGGSPQVLTDARFLILGDGTLQVTEVVDGVDPEDACVISVVPTLEGDVLSFRIMDVPCDVDPQIATTAFFELLPYSRAER